MKTPRSVEQLVLNAASDDFENLEHIYRSVALEFSAANFKPTDPNCFYWREAANAPSLAEIAEAIKRLTAEGLLEARTESGAVPEMSGDSAFVWRAWFHATKEGLTMLHKSITER